MKTKMKIKVGDVVRVMVGRAKEQGGDKGKEGKVIQAFPESNAVVVDGVRNRTKHVKPRGDQKGQKVQFFAPIPTSNVSLVGKTGTGRVGFEVKDGKKTRVLRAKKKVEQIG
ncbi:MAG: 50S ribosomal protein L24 [Patescibacteria group bacterium]